MTVATATAPAVTVKKKQAQVLMPDRFGLVGQKQNMFVVDLPFGVTEEDFMDPGYWAHVADQMQPLDEIKVRAEDGSFVVYLLVAWCERNFAKVVFDRRVECTVSKEAPVNSVKHRVEWKGPHMKFCVIRNSDSSVLREGETKDGAARWLREFEAGQAR